MAFKNCEEYVLAELERVEGELEEVKKQNGELQRGIDYGNRAIGVLQQLNEICWREEDGVKNLYIRPTKGEIKLNMDNQDDRYVYELLAPIIGTEEVKAAHRASIEAEEAAVKGEE